MCITEGRSCSFGPTKLSVVVVGREEAAMAGYPEVYVKAKNHSEINKVVDEKDPTFVAIDGFMRDKFDPVFAGHSATPSA